jgi:hypothetical protein
MRVAFVTKGGIEVEQVYEPDPLLRADERDA